MTNHFMSKSWLLLARLMLFACTGNQQNHDHHTATGNAQVDSLKAQVMAVHDSVMPKMDDIMAYRMATQRRIKQLDSLSKINKAGNNQMQQQQLDSLLYQLDTADEAMMQWMQQFDGQMKAKTGSEKIVYLQNEKVRIDSVRNLMLGSIDRARKLLNQ